MNQKQFLALLGFAFVIAWLSFNFGYALLCLLGAGLFYGAGAFLQGELDLGEVQDRLRGSGSGSGSPSPYAPPPPPRAGARVR
jgi:hypothetical protein